MNDQDLDTKEKIIGMRKDLDYLLFRDEIIEILDQNKEIILATSFNDRVTARTVSFTNDGLTIFFMSWGHNKKIKQMEKNPKVALCLNNLQIEGTASILGSSRETENRPILNIFRKKFSERWLDTFSKIKEMVIVKVIPSSIVKFENINRRFHLQCLNLISKKAYQMRIEDVNNPNYPY